MFGWLRAFWVFAASKVHLYEPLAHAGFSLHAGVSCWSTNKARLEQLVRYTARPAVSEERLSEMENGLISYRLKKPWTDGTTHVVFSPLEFMEKLAALVPPPRIHLTRFHGILAPHSKWRSFVVPEKPEENFVFAGFLTEIYCNIVRLYNTTISTRVIPQTEI